MPKRRGGPEQPATARPGEQALFDRAGAALRAGDWAKAEHLCRGLAKRHGENPAFCEMYGAALMQQGKSTAAVGQFRRAIDRGLRSARIYNNLALALAGAGDSDAAAAAAETAARLEPRSAPLQANLANRLRGIGAIAEAKAAYGRALALDPGFVSAHVGLGNAHAALGEREAAVEQYRRALELRPGDARAFYHLVLTAKGGEAALDESLAESFRTRIERENVSAAESVLIHAALGMIADRRGAWDAAFHHFQAFNVMTRAARAGHGKAYDREAHRRWVDRLIEAFNAEYFEPETDKGAPNRRPLLIVGMPRSGTTLVEQILGAHPDVAAGGELTTIEDIAFALPDYPAGAGRLSDAERSERSARYLAHLEAIDPTAERVTDKMPQNFLHLGLVARLLPGAAIVHCRRDPVDTCLSCYFQNFQHGNPYANDLRDLGAFYRDYVRLMDHWRQVLPLEIIELGYEDLVSDPEPEVRRLLDRLGLAWDAGCLRFMDSRQAVLTASQWQVRQPIHGKSVGRWRHYKDHLAPLLAELGEHAG